MGKFHKTFGIVLVVVFFNIIHAQLCVCSNSSYGCIDGERQALLKFKQSFNDHSHRLSSWEGTNCCKWEGVDCDRRTGHVVKLVLRDMETRPEVSEINSCLLELKCLNYLDLSSNSFNLIPIPEFLGLMKHLKYLNLSFSTFDLIIPPQLGNLTNLQVLDIRGISELPPIIEDLEWVSRLSSLKYLDMSSVYLTGVRNLLQVLNMLPSLSVLRLSSCEIDNTHLSRPAHLNSTLLSTIQELDLSSNSFEGPFPHLLRNMTSLRVLDLSYNFHLNSSIPLWLGNLNNLVHLDLSYNAFNSVEGGLSRILWNLCYMKSLDLSHINFEKESLETINSRNLSGCIGYDLEILDVTRSGLSGYLPDWLGQFNKLKNLYLSFNSFYGPIPASIGNLTTLRELDLTYTQVNGTIPATIGNLLSLREVDLSNNQLNGEIPATIGSLSGLRELRLSMNQLNGAIPTTIGSLSALRELDISFNQLNGAIPSTIGSLSAMTELDLSHNQLTGVLPDSIGQLSNIKSVDLSFNSLKGKVSEIHFSNLSMLEKFMISSNQLTIKMKPDWVPPFQLKYMEMASCKIENQFPQWLATQKEVIIVLDLSNASISGPLPKWFPSFNNLTTLDLSHNQITGTLPQNICDMLPTLASLRLADNLINGTIPTSFCKMQALHALDLSKNMLSGDIPNCWAFQELRVLKLSSNKLTGVIPSSIGNLTGLLWLHLNNNSLKGELPVSLRNCTRLEVLNLGENGFSGIIPTWIGKELQELEILRLRKNMFDGYIPLQLCQLFSLQILDLANNYLMGTIPRCFGNLTGMTLTLNQKFSKFKAYQMSPFFDPEWDEENVVEVMKGNDIEYTTIIQLVANMDLSGNNLVGMIPKELTVLFSLLGLNLSRNHLTGSIPKDIGNLKSLESLDLSRNQLSGNIPTSMSDLTSLSYLNLSHNSFSGQIPTGHQLQTLVDPSIYAGNPKLCGAPLLKRCPGDEPPQVPIPKSDEENDEEDKSEKVWFYFVIALGYATGLWGVIGVLILKKNWRYAYFRFANETKDWIYVAVSVKAARMKTMRRNRSVE